MGDRCMNCNLPFDGSCRIPKTGPCGHVACCWTGQRCPICKKAFKFEELQNSYPLNRRDVLSPEPMEVVVEGPSTSSGAGKANLATVDVHCMNGAKLKEEVNTSTTVGEFKTTIEEKTGISKERQTLLCNAKTMGADKRTLGSYGVTSGSRIQMGNKCSGG